MLQRIRLSETYEYKESDFELGSFAALRSARNEIANELMSSEVIKPLRRYFVEHPKLIRHLSVFFPQKRNESRSQNIKSAERYQWRAFIDCFRLKKPESKPHPTNMKAVVVVLLALNVTFIQSQWIVARICSGAPPNYFREVRALNGDCAQMKENEWSQIYCDESMATAYTCSDSKCKNCTKQFAAPLNKCNDYMKVTCQKDQPNLQDLMGEDYFVLGTRYNCNSVLNSLIASDPKCYGGQGTTFSAKCSRDLATIMAYSNENCTGEPYQSYNMALNQCENGVEYFCNEN